MGARRACGRRTRACEDEQALTISNLARPWCRAPADMGSSVIAQASHAFRDRHGTARLIESAFPSRDDLRAADVLGWRERHAPIHYFDAWPVAVPTFAGSCSNLSRNDGGFDESLYRSARRGRRSRGGRHARLARRAGSHAAIAERAGRAQHHRRGRGTRPAPGRVRGLQGRKAEPRLEDHLCKGTRARARWRRSRRSRTPARAISTSC